VKRSEYAGGASARFLLMGTALFLTIFGLVMIYSASSISALVKEGSAMHFFIRQFAFVVFGVVCATVVARFDYRRFQGALGTQAWWVAIALLAATFLLGIVRGGARRWIPLGFFNLQPSELAKIACILVAAGLTVEWQRKRMDTGSYLRKMGFFVGVPAVLIVAQPDLGTAILLAIGVATVLFLGGIGMRWVGAAAVVVVGFGMFAIWIEPYRFKRVISAFDPWADPLKSGYQAVQALFAFGTGGISGVGLGLSRQKFFYLPEAHTDFIFAIIGEEAGLIGTLAIVVGFGILLYAGVRIAMGARDPFGRLVAGAITSMLVFQAVLNMSAVTGIFPITGKPLPFVSYGGSSMLVTMICVGLMLSVSKYGALAPRAVRVAPRKEETKRASSDERRRNSRPRVPSAGSGRGTRRRA